MVVFNQVYDKSQLSAAAAAFWDVAKDHRVITFSGEMGAGKTTFIGELCRLLKVEDHVSSPTFALVNEYELSFEGKLFPLYHIDWYRLKNAGEAVEAGMEDYLTDAVGGAAYCLIEWPERALELLPPSYLHVQINLVDTETREMVVSLIS